MCRGIRWLLHQVSLAGAILQAMEISAPTMMELASLRLVNFRSLAASFRSRSELRVVNKGKVAKFLVVISNKLPLYNGSCHQRHLDKRPPISLIRKRAVCFQ